MFHTTADTELRISLSNMKISVTKTGVHLVLKKIMLQPCFVVTDDDVVVTCGMLAVCV